MLPLLLSDQESTSNKNSLCISTPDAGSSLPKSSPRIEEKHKTPLDLFYLFIYVSPLSLLQWQLLNEDWWNKAGMSTISQVQVLCAHVRSAPPTVGMMMLTGAM